MWPLSIRPARKAWGREGCERPAEESVPIASQLPSRGALVAQKHQVGDTLKPPLSSNRLQLNSRGRKEEPQSSPQMRGLK